MELSEFKRVLQQVMVLPVVVLLILAGVLIVQLRLASSTVELIELADRRIALANLLERLVVDEETGLRGYQITGDPRFLRPYRQTAGPMQETVRELRDTYPSGSSLYLQAFLEEHHMWAATFAEPTIAAVGAGLTTSDDDINLTGRERMDAMRRDLNDIVQNSERLRIQRLALWHTQLRHTLYALGLLALAVGLFIALFTRERLETVSLAFRRSLDLQRRRSEELFQSEQHLRTTLASIGDAVITCDADGCVQTMNIVAQELTGWTEHEARTRPLEEVFQIINEVTRAPVQNPVEQVKQLDRLVGFTNHTVLIRRNGSEIAIDNSGSPIRDESGQLTGVVMVFRDISMERRTRAALLANEKLAVAGRLAATIAHEIHNPLDSVSNLIYLLQQGSSPEESRHFLDLAQSELARVTQISRAMLSLYRESKAPVPIDLKETLQDLLLLMERRFTELGVHVTCDLPEHITVEGFPAELRQVFTNLITNAAEAAGQNGTVHVRIRSSDPHTTSFAGPDGVMPTAGAVVEISDTGPGIPPELREHLFQPFFTTKGERGTGLGLWVSQGIIRKHGGTLRLDNREGDTGHGTVASVFLATRPTLDLGAI